VVISLFALAVSLLLLQLVKPFMLNLKFAQVLRWDLEGNPYVYLVFVAFSLVIGTLAGLFPSMVLSRFQPVKVLKNFGSMKLFSKIGLRKSLLVFQFALSLIFILSVVLLYNQLSLFVNADHGFDMANKINVRLNDSSPEQLKTEILTYSNIENVSASSHVPAAGTTYGDSFKRKLDDTEGTNMDYFYTDEDYLQNMNIKLIAGRFFQQNAPETNKKQIVINTTAVKAFHFDSPQDALGELIYQSQDSANLKSLALLKTITTSF
jgi:putative ABC transport system permease protein